MFEHIRQWVLRATLVPPEPHPPLGAPGSVRVFRAGRNYYRLCLLKWGIGQIGAVVGIVVSLTFLYHVGRRVETLQAQSQTQSTTPRFTSPVTGSTVIAPAVTADAAQKLALTPEDPSTKAVKKSSQRPRRSGQRMGPVESLAMILAHGPPWVFPLVRIAEWGAVLLFLLQLPVTYAAVRLEFEQHWYIVTDRSLRIRTGLFRLQESTMSFANLQQVEVSQGPLDRLLGLSNLRVQSAGGGGGGHGQAHTTKDTLHSGTFHGVDNAPEIKDLVLNRLKYFGESGLGDPTEKTSPVRSAASAPLHQTNENSTLTAARALLQESKALRRVLS